MVKSNGSSGIRQYMHNKPCKWGYKFWVLANKPGYTYNFDLYSGDSNDKSENNLRYGIGCDVVFKLMQPLLD